mgnify:CR=1 FL=1
MSPKIVVSKGERIMEVNLSDRAAKLAARVLWEEVKNNLTDPETRRYYPDEIEVIEELLELGKSLRETSQ